MKQSFQFTEKLPTVPGWYWERRKSGLRIIQLDKHNMPTRTAQERKNLVINTLLEGGMSSEELREIEKKPLENWRVEYAGPLVPPS